MSESLVIFDSRKATNVYKHHDHYRSGNFSVPVGHVALVELTTKHDLLDQVVFTAVRTPLGLGSECYDLDGIGKRYRQVECSDILPYQKVESNTVFTPYRKSIWRLGNDKFNDEVFEYRYILRPGSYYLIADKSTNDVISNCESPTIVEVSIFPINHVANIHSTCGGK